MATAWGLKAEDLELDMGVWGNGFLELGVLAGPQARHLPQPHSSDPAAPCSALTPT